MEYEIAGRSPKLIDGERRPESSCSLEPRHGEPREKLARRYFFGQASAPDTYIEATRGERFAEIQCPDCAEEMIEVECELRSDAKLLECHDLVSRAPDAGVVRAEHRGRAILDRIQRAAHDELAMRCSQCFDVLDADREDHEIEATLAS